MERSNSEIRLSSSLEKWQYGYTTSVTADLTLQTFFLHDQTTFALKRIPLRFMLYALCFVQSCGHDTSPVKQPGLPDQFIAVLGIMQDAGYPQAGCDKRMLQRLPKGAEEKVVTCLALVDRKANQYWLFEVTPDITSPSFIQQYLSSCGRSYPCRYSLRMRT